MKFEIKHLGDLAGPLLLFGGPYSNLEATKALKEVADSLGIPANRTICTGDILAYCGAPYETLELVRDWGIHVVRGNCEISFGTDAPDCGCGFEEGSVCSALSVDWYRFARGEINSEQKEWMINRPARIEFNISGRSVAVAHGGVAVVNRFIFPSTAESVKREELRLADTDIIIAGHSGIPAATLLGDKAWLNAGVIGMPANDGTCDGWYLLLHVEAPGTLRMGWHRLKYDAARASQTMRKNGLSGGYDRTLLNGIWPSMDILPEIEKKRVGIPIELADVVLKGPAL